MKKFFLFLIPAFLLMRAFAVPFSCSNFYIEGFAGLNIINRFEEEDVRLDTNPGFALGGSFGYRFSRFFRLEAEAAYRHNTFDLLTVQNIEFPASGSIHKVTAMANGIIEIPLNRYGIVPYIGAGIGERWDHATFQLEPIHTPDAIIIFNAVKSKSNGIAYQAIAGLTFLVCPKMQAAFEYRYLDGSHIQGNHTLDLTLRRYF